MIPDAICDARGIGMGTVQYVPGTVQVQVPGTCILLLYCTWYFWSTGSSVSHYAVRSQSGICYLWYLYKYLYFLIFWTIPVVIGNHEPWVRQMGWPCLPMGRLQGMHRRQVQMQASITPLPSWFPRTRIRLCRWSQSGLPLTVNDERVLCLQKSVSVHPAISSDQQRSSQSKSLPVVGEILSSIKQDVASYAGDAAGNQYSRITLQQRLATKDPRLPLDHLDASIYALFQSPTPLLSLTNPTHLRLPTRRSFLRKSPYSNTPIIRHGGRPY